MNNLAYNSREPANVGPKVEEVIRNFFIRQPVLWVDQPSAPKAKSAP